MYTWADRSSTVDSYPIVVRRGRPEAILSGYESLEAIASSAEWATAAVVVAHFFDI